MTRLAEWSIVAGAVVLVGAGIVAVPARRIKGQLEEKARRSVVEYLEKRFDSRVEFQSVDISLPRVSSFALLLRKGRGVVATVDGAGLVLHLRHDAAAPPFFKISHFRFFLDLGLLAGPVKNIPRVEIEGIEITVPPKGERPSVATAQDSGPPGGEASVTFKEILLKNAVLVLLPRDNHKPPLRFDIDDLLMKDAGPASAMAYRAHLTNPRPRGQIEATGHFGPWNKEEPGDTNLDGVYRFDNADLAIFGGIRGILSSTGSFSGTLDRIQVGGETRIPNFALQSAGNAMPLVTQFDALVDGTNGNTTLKPVKALLGGKTRFVTSGAIIRHEDFGKRSIDLLVRMKGGDVSEVLRLGMKGEPFMKGSLQVGAKISIPPLNAKVRQKLGLTGSFAVTDGMFLKSSMQDRVDDLSRRGQGQPKNPSIDDVVYNLRGGFDMRNEAITLSNVAFGVPGAAVALNGTYDMVSDSLDFHGELRLDAKVSQTLTGWKRWVAKPIDPFFARDGAGTLLRIRISGAAANPEFGLDHEKRSKP